jgi:hypothetical protein
MSTLVLPPGSSLLARGVVSRSPAMLDDWCKGELRPIAPVSAALFEGDERKRGEEEATTALAAA